MITDNGAPTPDTSPRPPLRDDAVRLGGTTRRGRSCALIDNTGERLPERELESLLAALIEQDRFGFRVAGDARSGALAIDPPQGAHIQIGAKLYRLVIHRYEARIEPF